MCCSDDPLQVVVGDVATVTNSPEPTGALLILLFLRSGGFLQYAHVRSWWAPHPQCDPDIAERNERPLSVDPCWQIRTGAASLQKARSSGGGRLASRNGPHLQWAWDRYPSESIRGPCLRWDLFVSTPV